MGVRCYHEHQTEPQRFDLMRFAEGLSLKKACRLMVCDVPAVGGHGLVGGHEWYCQRGLCMGSAWALQVWPQRSECYARGAPTKVVCAECMKMCCLGGRIL